MRKQEIGFFFCLLKRWADMTTKVCKYADLLFAVFGGGPFVNFGRLFLRVVFLNNGKGKDGWRVPQTFDDFTDACGGGCLERNTRIVSLVACEILRFGARRIVVGRCGGAMKDRSNYAGFFDSRFRSFGFGIRGRDAGAILSLCLLLCNSYKG